MIIKDVQIMCLISAYVCKLTDTVTIGKEKQNRFNFIISSMTPVVRL